MLHVIIVGINYMIIILLYLELMKIKAIHKLQILSHLKIQIISVFILLIFS